MNNAKEIDVVPVAANVYATTVHETLKLADALMPHELQGVSYVISNVQKIMMILNEKLKKMQRK